MRTVRWMCGVKLRGPRPRARPKRTEREVVKTKRMPWIAVNGGS